MPKIIMVTPGGETVVGTIKSLVESLQFAAMLQALTIGTTQTYYVEHRYKGKLRRTKPDTFATTVGNLKSLYDHLKPLYINE
jgi:hypothetical protein